MSKKIFERKYRVQTTRLLSRDYRACGFYFVTWITQNRAPTLSKIKNNLVHLTPAGKIVTSEIYETMIVRPNVHIDEFVIMPDHVHVLFHFWDVETARRAVSMPTYANSLGAIIGQIKSQSTKRIRTFMPQFAW